MSIRAGIIGGAGYTGGKVVRLLLGHPRADLVFVQSRSQSGNPITRVHQDLVGDTSLVFTDSYETGVDVLFLCLRHGESTKFLAENSFPESVRIIDLGNDFRLGARAGNREFVYGLPELQRDNIKKAKNVANPGCFATTIELGLLPLAKAGILKDAYTTGITGTTGAGQQVQPATHFSWRSSNISAYKTLTHQHLNEIHQTLRVLQPNFAGSVNFVPWRGDFTRGIFVSTTVSTPLSLDELNTLYGEFYKTHPFTHVAQAMIDMKQVVNTNKCLIFIEKVGDKAVIHSTTDNLLKGASGQAVQNMNLMFGIDETAGLKLKGSIF